MLLLQFNDRAISGAQKESLERKPYHVCFSSEESLRYWGLTAAGRKGAPTGEVSTKAHDFCFCLVLF